MNSHYKTLDISRGIQTLSTFLTKKPMATDESHFLLIFSSPGPQGVAPYKVEIQKRFSSIFIADVSGILLILPMMFKYSDYSPPGPGIKILYCKQRRRRSGTNELEVCVPQTSSNPFWDFLSSEARCRPSMKGLYWEILLFQNGLNF